MQKGRPVFKENPAFISHDDPAALLTTDKRGMLHVTNYLATHWSATEPDILRESLHSAAPAQSGALIWGNWPIHLLLRKYS
jgi:hypothetical protein